MRLCNQKTRVVTFWFLSQTPMCWVKKRIKGAKNEKEELRGRELWPNSMPSFPWITMVSSSFPLPACDYTLGPNFFTEKFVLFLVCDLLYLWSFWVVLFLVRAVFGSCFFWLVLFLVRALFGSCSFWLVPFLVGAVFGSCPFWFVLFLVQEPKKARTKNRTSLKQHEPKRARTKNQKEHKPKTART